MIQKYSTGDLAKLCNVSVRTVQFYDKEGLIIPSEFSEGGRRIYTEDDLNKLNSVCLYKTLGLSLDEIRPIIKGNNNKEFMIGILTEQQLKVNVEIEKMIVTKEKLGTIMEQIVDTGGLDIKSIDELEKLIIKKEKHRKTDMITYMFMGCFLIVLFTGFPMVISIGGPAVWGFCGIIVMLLMGLIYYHKEVNAYLCPHCQFKFSIGFFKDMVSLNGGKKGKYLKCPQCGKRDWIKESFQE